MKRSLYRRATPEELAAIPGPPLPKRAVKAPKKPAKKAKRSRV